MFVFGMSMMSDSLQVVAGGSLKNIVNKLTKNSFTAMLTGLIISGLIQSSSATTVMVVGFVNAGLMSLPQAIGVILGANIGTTVTAQLIAFKLTDFVWPILAVGSGIIFFTKGKRNRAIGETLIGFALLFLGMKFMSEPLLEYGSNEGFKKIFVTFSQNRLYGLLAGVFVTLLVQSSSATVGLTMSLMDTNAFGDEPFLALMAAVPIILGDNIGTCITALLASIGTARNARRTALAHLVFNTCGAILILPFLQPFCNLIMATSNSGIRQIANAHSIFNVLNVSIFLSLIKVLERLVLFFIPVTEDEGSICPSLDKRLLKTPAIALAQAENHLFTLLGLVGKKLELLLSILQLEELKKEDFLDLEGNLEDMTKRCHEIRGDLNQFLIYLAQKDLSDELNQKVTRCIYVNKDGEIFSSQISRLGRHLIQQAEGGFVVSDNSKEELQICVASIKETYLALIENRSLGRWQAENIGVLINSQVVINGEARHALLSRIQNSEHSPMQSVMLLDSLRSVESLLNSMRYLRDHLRFKF